MCWTMNRLEANNPRADISADENKLVQLRHRHSLRVSLRSYFANNKSLAVLGLHSNYLHLLLDFKSTSIVGL